jgi:hypothetical protein
MNKMIQRPLPLSLRFAVRVTLVAAICVPGAAGAIDFEAGGWTGSLNTTLSYGQLWRDEKRDPRLIATANGGTGRSPNIDDGNLNWDVDRVSSAFKVVSELSLDRGNYGLFVRGSALYDYPVEEDKSERTDISESGKNLAGAYTRLLDAFAYGRWDLSGHELEVRGGRQVVNWGESTFIQGGINNAINHFDVSALRVPGSELREAYLPQEMLKVSYALTDNVTAEAIAIFDWDETEPEPVGSYFASNDFVPRGGEKVILGFGAFSDQGVDYRPLGGPLIEDFQAVPRGPTIKADSQGQYGAALKWFLPDFNQGTEFGFYFVNYHSKLPLISGRTGTQVGIGNSVGTLTTVIATAQALAGGQPMAAIFRLRPRRSTRRSPPTRCLAAAASAPRRPISRRTSMRRPPTISPSTRKTSSCSASRSIRNSVRPASPCRAKCPTGTMCRCSSTTSSCCSPR